jgi:hypothetical protein
MGTAAVITVEAEISAQHIPLLPRKLAIVKGSITAFELVRIKANKDSFQAAIVFKRATAAIDGRT